LSLHDALPILSLCLSLTADLLMNESADSFGSSVKLSYLALTPHPPLAKKMKDGKDDDFSFCSGLLSTSLSLSLSLSSIPICLHCFLLFSSTVSLSLSLSLTPPLSVWLCVMCLKVT